MFDLLQWPALLGLTAAVWLMSAGTARRRSAGAALAVAASALWAVWGWHASAWALVVLPLALAAVALFRRAEGSPPADGLSEPDADAREALRSRRPDADFAALVRSSAAAERRPGRPRRGSDSVEV